MDSVMLKCQTIDISRGPTHDGPGMRTTVFLKGCPLNCAWCQNPEGISYTQEVWWEQRKCIHCLSCQEACPEDAIIEEGDRLRIDRAEFIRQLSAQGIGASVHFIPLHLHPYYRNTYGYRPEDLPVATRVYERLISLPIYPTLTDTQVKRIIGAVRDIAQTNRA